MSTVAPFVAVSTTVCPNRRPPRPKHPKFTQFHRSGLHFGRIHPQHRQYGDSSKAYGIATASVGDGARPDIGNDAPIRIIHHNPTGVEGAGGTGGPGRASRRGAERSEVAQPRGRPDPPAPGTPAGPSCASCGRRQGLAGQRADAPNHTSTTCPTGMEGTGGTGGHGQPDPKAPGTLAAPPVTPHTRRRRCGGRRRDRRARAGFEARRRTK